MNRLLFFIPVLLLVASRFSLIEVQGAPAPPAEVVASLAAPVIQRDAGGTVTIACATPGAVIRYSLDGTDPGPKTGPYLAPIMLASGGVIKARAFSEDRKQMSELA